MPTPAEIAEVKQKLNDLKGNCACIDWRSFSDKGSPCNSWTPAPAAEAICIAAVRICAPIDSGTYVDIAREIKVVTGVKKLHSYDCVTKMIARLFFLSTESELRNAYSLSNAVRREMKKRGLSEISSLDDVCIKAADFVF